jgi:hypothetical protein
LADGIICQAEISRNLHAGLYRAHNRFQAFGSARQARCNRLCEVVNIAEILSHHRLVTTTHSNETVHGQASRMAQVVAHFRMLWYHKLHSSRPR